jgi:hypothetical protein
MDHLWFSTSAPSKQTQCKSFQAVFLNHLSCAKGEQCGEADKTQEDFGELIVVDGDPTPALNPLEKIFYPVAASVELSLRRAQA